MFNINERDTTMHSTITRRAALTGTAHARAPGARTRASGPVRDDATAVRRKARLFMTDHCTDWHAGALKLLATLGYDFRYHSGLEVHLCVMHS